jgi:hypothetical protein
MNRRNPGAMNMNLQRKEHWMSQGKEVSWNSLEHLPPPGTGGEVFLVLLNSQDAIYHVISGFTWAEVLDLRAVDGAVCLWKL